MKNKNYWAMYYGIPVTLPNKQFYKKIKEINCLAEESAKKFNKNKKVI